MSQIPKQKISTSKKTDEWAKKCLDAYIEESSFADGSRSDLLSLYRLYNGQIDKSAYSYVLNPYNSPNSTGKTRNFPAKLRNYNIVKPVVDLLVGEKAKRSNGFTDFQVVVRNADAKSKQLEDTHNAVLKNLQQRFINELNALGQETGQESQEVPPPESVAEFAEANYKDARAIIGQQSLGYLRDYLDLDDKYQTAFFDWLVTGSVYTYKDICMDEVEYEIVSPIDIDFQKSPDLEYIEDADWVVRRKSMSVNNIIDAFYDVLTPDQIDSLENPRTGDGGTSLRIPFLKSQASADAMTNHSVDVMHVVWKSFRKIGILMYTDEMGIQQEMEVDEYAKFDKSLGESIKWYWVNQVWEGYRLGNDIYVGMQPTQVQRTALTNLSKCKLPYNGRLYSARHADNTSLVNMGSAYQLLYNVFHYRLELSIAKNKDKIALIEMNTIPKKQGWDEDKFMYYADAMGFAFIDSTAEGKGGERVAFNQFQVLDMSLGQYIAAQFELLMAVKQEWEDLIGITRQRKGQVMASDGAGVTERAVFQSSVMTEELYRKFDKFVEKEMQGFIDVAKFAWQGGKKSSYINSDYKSEMLDIDGREFAEAEIAVFAKNSSRENTKLETFKNIALSFAQNGTNPSTIAEILDTDNFSNIKRLTKVAEQKQQELAQQQQEQMDKMESQKLEVERELHEDKQAHESLENQLDRDNKIQLESMKIAASQEDQDQNDNGIPDYIDVQKVALEEKKLDSSNKLQERKLDIEEKKLSQANKPKK